jgi:hypothetical protein
MQGILADINVEGQRDAILSIWTTAGWRDLWNGLGLVVVNFPSLGLPYNASDAVICTTCASGKGSSWLQGTAVIRN